MLTITHSLKAFWEGSWLTQACSPSRTRLANPQVPAGSWRVLPPPRAGAEFSSPSGLARPFKAFLGLPAP